ncbi:MAG: hypothetical protein ACRBDI_03365 [Alphaproteobacteria bacterium]
MEQFQHAKENDEYTQQDHDDIKKFLVNSPLSLTDITDIKKFIDNKTMFSNFEEFEGITPKEYRANEMNILVERLKNTHVVEHRDSGAYLSAEDHARVMNLITNTPLSIKKIQEIYDINANQFRRGFISLEGQKPLHARSGAIMKILKEHIPHIEENEYYNELSKGGKSNPYEDKRELVGKVIECIEQTPDLKLTEISLQAGFHNLADCRRIFKAQTGRLLEDYIEDQKFSSSSPSSLLGQYMKTIYPQDAGLSVEDVAAHFCVSPQELKDNVWKETNLTFDDFINEVMGEKAAIEVIGKPTLETLDR